MNKKLPGRAGNRPRAASKAVYTALGVPSIRAGLEELKGVEELKRRGVEESKSREVDRLKSELFGCSTSRLFDCLPCLL